MKRNFFVAFAFMLTVSFAGVSAQDRGLFVSLSGTVCGNYETGVGSNDYDFKTFEDLSGNPGAMPYSDRESFNANLSLGYRFSDKGDGARYAVAVNMGLGKDNTHYRDEELGDAFTNLLVLDLYAGLSFIRRISLGNGFFLDPTVDFQFRFTSSGYPIMDELSTYITRKAEVILRPLVLEYRFPQYDKLAIKAGAGEIAYSYRTAEWIRDPYQMFMISPDMFLGATFYF